MQEPIEQTSEKNNTKEYSVTIDLSKSRSAKSYDTDNIIQKEALKEVEGHIESILGSVKEYKEETEDITPEFDYYPREHNTITISGSRGSGKTSFILSVMNLISDPKNKFKGDNSRKYFKETYDKLSVLGLVDPTIVSTKEHILINVIARIKKKVTEEYKKQHKKRQDDYDTWKKSLVDLSGGLVQLDSVGSNTGLNHNGWDDPMLVMGEGLTNATEGFKLEFLLHEFIKQSLKFIDKTSFVIAFDDIDTKFNSGWPVLEIIRMYLTTPQLIVMLSGDLELFTTLVRNEQWKLFEGRFITNDKRENKNGHINFHAQVDELEEQYLLKILPPHSRVYLRNIKEIHNKIVINKYPLDEYLTFIAKDIFYYISDKDIGYIRELIYHLQIRTILQVLRAYDDCSEYDIKMKHLEISKKLVSIFISSLQKSGLNNIELELFNSPLRFNALAIKLLNLKIINDGFKLKPNSLDIHQNILSLVLNSVLNVHVRSSILTSSIEYWLKVGLSRETAISRYREISIREAASSGRVHYSERRELPFNEYIEAVSLKNEDSALQFSRKWLAFRNSTRINYNEKEQTAISLSVLRTEPKNKNQFEEYLRAMTLNSEYINPNTFNKVISNSENIQKNVAPLLIPFVTTFNPTTGRKKTYASFLNIIGFLGLNSFDNIVKHSTIQIVPEPFSSIDSINVSTENDEVTNENINKNPLIKDLREWQVSTEDEYGYPISLWADIWARFYYSLQKIDNSNLLVGTYLHRCIIIFLNSVLVEEYLFESKGENDLDLILTTPVVSDDIFISNFDKMCEYRDDDPERLSLSNIFITCPLLHFYLRPNNQLTERVKDLEHSLENLTVRNNIYAYQVLNAIYTPISENIVIPLKETKSSLQKVNKVINNNEAQKLYRDFEKIYTSKVLKVELDEILVPKIKEYQLLGRNDVSLKAISNIRRTKKYKKLESSVLPNVEVNKFPLLKSKIEVSLKRYIINIIESDSKRLKVLKLGARQSVFSQYINHLRNEEQIDLISKFLLLSNEYKDLLLAFFKNSTGNERQNLINKLLMMESYDIQNSLHKVVLGRQPLHKQNSEKSDSKLSKLASGAKDVSTIIKMVKDFLSLLNALGDEE